MKANQLMKRNVDALLKERHLQRKDLAQWCRRGESWISKIMKEDHREFPMKYWDRIADFFGVATYQLLQPGWQGGYERRAGLDRRKGTDRRKSAINLQVRESVSQVVASLTPEDVADLIRLRGLPAEQRAAVRTAWEAMPRSRGRTRTLRPEAPAAATPRVEAIRPQAHDAGEPRKRGKTT